MVHTSGQPESRKKGTHKIPDSVFELVHEPRNKTEKDNLRHLMENVYDAEYLYKNGRITKAERDSIIEDEEDIYERGH